MNRRSFIASSSTGIISAMSSREIAGGDAAQDPHPIWLKEWRELRGQWENFEEGSPEEEAIWKREFELADLIAETSPQTRAGLLAQLEWLSEDIGEYLQSISSYDLSGIIRNAVSGLAAT